MKKLFLLVTFTGVTVSFAQTGKLNGDWALSYIQMNSGKPEFNPFYVRNGVEIRFKDDGKGGAFEAHDMCNRAVGKYAVPENGKFVITEFGVTEKACTVNWPDNFWQLLQKISSVLVVGDNLYLHFDDGRNLMAFERAPERRSDTVGK